MPKICMFENCKTQAAYNIVNNPSLYCGLHKKEGMVHVKNKSERKCCIEPKCKKNPSYNFQGETNKLYCTHHKKENMIDIKHKKCIEPECIKIPNFNYEGEITALYCGQHKKEGMVDISHKKCIEIGCKKRPNFNYEGLTSLYCSDHKKEGMVDISHKKCIENNCKIQPTFNYEGEIKAIYCSNHKKEGMVDIKKNNCIEDNCKISATFNYEGKTPALYCASHKKEGMINNKKKCLYIGCNKNQSHNYKEELSPIYCSTHKKEGMINIITKRCIYNNCDIFPCYNFEGETNALYCLEHKKEGMCDIKNKSKLCNTPFCITRSQLKYEGYCLFCFINTFPDKHVSRNYKTKEKDVVDNILKIFPQFSWISDKKIKDGCSKRRPDLLLDMGEHVIIVEVDENKHNQYDCSCENKRLMELSQDLQHRPIIFIRFNPDEYINTDGIKIKSCWSLNKFGIMYITKEKIIEWNKRINILKEQIQYWIDHKPYKTIEIIELFY
jgi:hypothetical protein